MRWKISAFYYIFWGCQVAVFLTGVAQIYYLVSKQNNKITLLFNLLSSGIISAIEAGTVVIVCWYNNIEMLSVPFPKLHKHVNMHKSCLNFVGILLSFYLINSVIQMIPHILISYYAFPTTTLMQLAFFQVSFVSLTVAFGGTILLVERCLWIMHIKKTGKVPTDLNFTYLIDDYVILNPPQPESQNQPITSTDTEESETAVDRPQGTNLDDQNNGQNSSQESPSIQNEVEIELRNNAELKYSTYFTVFILLSQIVASIFGLIALIAIIILIEAIISDATSKDSWQGILTILPTIAVDAVIVLTRKRFFGNEKALRSQITSVIEPNNVGTSDSETVCESHQTSMQQQSQSSGSLRVRRNTKHSDGTLPDEKTFLLGQN